jgi:four helix bundle protein
MTVKRFEDLKIWQQAKGLANLIYHLTGTSTFKYDKGLSDQSRRAAVSVMANIAEGFERGSNKEFIQFLFIAKGSCGELRSHLILAQERGYITPEQHTQAREMALGVSTMVYNFITYLQNTKVKGKRCQKTSATVTTTSTS